MTHKTLIVGACRWLSCLLFASLLSGCSMKVTMDDLREMQPVRHADTDKLGRMVGEWETSGEARIMGMDEPLQVTGSSVVTWEANGWFLLERASFRMADLEPAYMISVWYYDSDDDKYRMMYVDTFGAVGNAKSKPDCSNENLWSMRSRSKSPFGSSIGRGTMTWVDDNTLEFTFTEYAGPFKLFRVFDMKGTSKRKQ